MKSWTLGAKAEIFMRGGNGDAMLCYLHIPTLIGITLLISAMIHPRTSRVCWFACLVSLWCGVGETTNTGFVEHNI
jgi:hypothetical protein